MAEKPPGKDATPEQIKAWRQSTGRPEAPEGYFNSLPKELQFQEYEKPLILDYLKTAHEAGDHPDVVKRNLEVYNKAQQALYQQVQQRDSESKQAVESTLRQEWGGEYQTNMNIFNNFMKANFPAEMEKSLQAARLGDDKSTILMNSPAFVKSMVRLAREMNPAGVVTGSEGMDNISSINDQIKAYEKRMASKEWFKDEKAQAHYRQLVTARDRYESQDKRSSGRR
jgi:hypothetical protein